MKFLILSVFLTGCAVSSIVIKQEEMQPYKEASQISFISVSRDLNLVSITDKRENQSDVGQGLTGSTYSKTPVYLAHGATNFVRTYFKTALEKRNIILDSNSKNTFEIEIQELWVKEVIEKFKPEKAQCQVKLNFIVKNRKGTWTSKKWIKFLSGGDMTDGTERLAPTLASCMNDLVEKLVNDRGFKKSLI